MFHVINGMSPSAACAGGARNRDQAGREKSNQGGRQQRHLCLDIRPPHLPTRDGRRTPPVRPPRTAREHLLYGQSSLTVQLDASLRAASEAGCSQRDVHRVGVQPGAEHQRVERLL